jgi:hypothetical protein
MSGSNSSGMQLTVSKAGSFMRWKFLDGLNSQCSG